MAGNRSAPETDAQAALLRPTMYWEYHRRIEPAFAEQVARICNSMHGDGFFPKVSRNGFKTFLNARMKNSGKERAHARWAALFGAIPPEAVTPNKHVFREFCVLDDSPEMDTDPRSPCVVAPALWNEAALSRWE